MAIQYADSIADAAGTVPDTYNITASNDQFSISIDGGSNQVFTLTHGSTRTAAQIVADLSGLTGATATAAVVGGGLNVLRIRTTSANGNSSSILVNAPSNNANATLGFVATTYYGGAAGSYHFGMEPVASQQDMINGIETCLLSAGWITVSGHNTTLLKMQSSLTPNPQNLRMRIQVKYQGGTFSGIQIAMTNAFETLGASTFTASLNPVIGKHYQVIASKHQAAIFIPGQMNGVDYIMFGTPWIPSTMGGVIFDSMFISSNSSGDNSGVNNSFRTSLGVCSSAFRAVMYNRSYWETTFNPSQQGDPCLFAYLGQPRTGTQPYRWADRSAMIYDPYISWGQRDLNDEGEIRGQLWNAFMCSDSYQLDQQISNVDGHTWQATTYGQPTLMLMVA